jgi:magnesium chelatase accessory protein
MLTGRDKNSIPLDWPHRNRSEFIETKNLTWHIQQWTDKKTEKKKPLLLLLHGTGSSTHSWRDIAPILATGFRVLVPDLPGHAFSSLPNNRWMSLQGMADAIDELLVHLGDLKPDLIVGHSAGAAVAIQLALNNGYTPQCIVSINGALLPLDNLSSLLFSPIAKLLDLNPLIPKLFAWRATNPKVTKNLIHSTGSKLDKDGLRYYASLVSNSQHASGVLKMMANWDLTWLDENIAKLRTPLTMIVGDNDKTLPPSLANRVKIQLPNANIVTLNGLGHLAHEENPCLIAEIISQNYIKAS